MLLFLCCLILISTMVPVARAVICESFKNPEQCERTFTSSGGCRWNQENVCVSDPSKPLPPGVVAIASIDSIEVPRIYMNEPIAEVGE